MTGPARSPIANDNYPPHDPEVNDDKTDDNYPPTSRAL